MDNKRCICREGEPLTMDKDNLEIWHELVGSMEEFIGIVMPQIPDEDTPEIRAAIRRLGHAHARACSALLGPGAKDIEIKRQGLNN